MSGERLRDEVIDLARDLIRVDTSNPPGNETPAAELLAAYLRDAGVDEVELVGPDPDRLNLVARIAGAGDGPSLMLLAHTDVVPAPRDGWTVDPFEGAVRDGRLIGRGAVDMKGELAARAAALAAVALDGRRPAGDLVLVAEADEERNVSDVGLSWLVRERPDLRCDYAINEGGGSRARAGVRWTGGADFGRREARQLAAAADARDRRPRLGARGSRQPARACGGGDRATGRPPPARRASRGRRGDPRGARRPSRRRRRADRLGARREPVPRRAAQRRRAPDRDPDRRPRIGARKRGPAPRRCDLRLPGTAGTGRGRGPRPRRRRAWRRSPLRARVPRAAGRRHRVTDRDPALRRARAVFGGARPGGPGAAADRCRVHRLALGARGVRHRRLRVRPGAPRRSRRLPRRGPRHRRVAWRSTTWSRWPSSTCSRSRPSGAEVDRRAFGTHGRRTHSARTAHPFDTPDAPRSTPVSRISPDARGDVTRGR